MASQATDGLDPSAQNLASQHLNGNPGVGLGLQITINCQTVVIERPPAAADLQNLPPSPRVWVRSRGIMSFVETLYRNILDRDEKDQNVVDVWTKNTYTHGLAHTIAEFFTSSEYSRRELPIEVTVDKFYLAVLGRHGEAQGRGYWIEQIGNGMTLSKVAEGFVKCAEYRRMVQEGTAPDPVHWPTD